MGIPACGPVYKPGGGGSAVAALPALLPADNPWKKANPASWPIGILFMERVMGIEPTIFSLGS